jgi:hypothetical protein
MAPDEAAALRIFVSYRREDSAPYAGRLFDSLGAHHGSLSVFIDIDSIDPGSDFGEAVHSSLEGCDAVIAVIGREWLSATDRTGRRRLDNPDDWVRLEIEAALQHRIRVIPVLVGGASMPSSAELPETLWSLARLNAFEITDRRWKYDTDQLIAFLERIRATKRAAPGRPRRSRPPEPGPRTGPALRPLHRRIGWKSWGAIATAVTTIAVIGIVVYLPSTNGWVGDSFRAGVIDRNRWDVQQTAGVSLDHDSGVAITLGSNAPAGPVEEGELTTTCRFQSNFDVEVSYSLPDWPPTSLGRLGIFGGISSQRITEAPERDYYVINVNPTGPGQAPSPPGSLLTEEPTIDHDGQLRVERVGTTYSGYARSGPGKPWTYLGDATKGPIEPTPISLGVWADKPAPLRGSFRDFRILAGRCT